MQSHLPLRQGFPGLFDTLVAPTVTRSPSQRTQTGVARSLTRRRGLGVRARMYQSLPWALFILGLALPVHGIAQSASQIPSLQELLDTKISSVGKKETHLLDTPAAIYVVTREEIRSSGVRNVPDALRLVPGIDRK